MKRALILWTGGKDSCLALHKTLEMGYRVAALVTFAPLDGEFRAHPIPMIRSQARSLGIEHRLVRIGSPYKEGYVKGLLGLAAQYEATTVVTGDIDEVEGQSNWIEECCREAGLAALLPLWQEDRERLLESLFSEKIEAVVTHLNDPRLPKGWIGRRLDERLLRELIAAKARYGIDLTGENGEFHTMVVRSPLFTFEVDAGQYFPVPKPLPEKRSAQTVLPR